MARKQTLSQRIALRNSTVPDEVLADAAPDLLESCEAIVKAWDDDEIGQIDGSLIEKARAVIAQARGGK